MYSRVGDFPFCGGGLIGFVPAGAPRHGGAALELCAAVTTVEGAALSEGRAVAAAADEEGSGEGGAAPALVGVGVGVTGDAP